jgi:hypothetical protein
MSQRIRNIVGKAKKAIARLVEEYRKGGPLYLENPKAVAHVSRTGKWLLNALAQLGPEARPLQEGSVS